MRSTVRLRWKIFWTKRSTPCGKFNANARMARPRNGNFGDVRGTGDIGKTKVTKLSRCCYTVQRWRISDWLVLSTCSFVCFRSLGLAYSPRSQHDGSHRFSVRGYVGEIRPSAKRSGLSSRCSFMVSRKK